MWCVDPPAEGAVDYLLGLLEAVKFYAKMDIPAWINDNMIAVGLFLG